MGSGIWIYDKEIKKVNNGKHKNNNHLLKKRKIPFITYIANDMELNIDGIKRILESGQSICIKDYDYYFLSEADAIRTDNEW